MGGNTIQHQNQFIKNKVIFENLLHPKQLTNQLCTTSHPPMALARPTMIQNDPITKMRVHHTKTDNSNISEFAHNLNQTRRRLLVEHFLQYRANLIATTLWHDLAPGPNFE